MIFTYLDLEMNQPSGKIIEVGWTIADPIANVVHKRNSMLVKIDEPLDPRIITLTGIDDNMLFTQGTSLELATRALLADHAEYGCFMNPATWGGGDSRELRDQTEDQELRRELFESFGYRWVDTKTIFQAYMMAHNSKTRAGLAKALTRFGLAFQGTKHRAGDDSFNTFRIHAELLRRIKEGVKIQHCGVC